MRQRGAPTNAYFILQQIEVPEWQKNQMITLEVTDLDAYWAELEGREMHVTDPAGVCWHVREAT